MRKRASIPALLVSVALGVWLLAAPDLLGLTDNARLIHVIVGPIVASVATIALWPVARLLVRVNVVLGIALALSPLVADHGALWVEPILTGVATALLALIPQSQAHRFGGGWRSLIGG